MNIGGGRWELGALAVALLIAPGATAGAEFSKPYSQPCVEREEVFEFTARPQAKDLGDDKHEITFAVKGYCDVTVGIVDSEGTVVRHLGSGVLGSNAPEPFQKNSLKQTIYWNGKDDLEEYVKEPGKLNVRVMLGLKPEFDKNLGATSPKSLPGFVGGIGVGPDGVYVLVVAGHDCIRKFDHDGNYLGTVAPPPAHLPEEKLGGYSYVEYEPGKRAVFGPDPATSLYRGWYMPAGLNARYGGVLATRPVVVGDRLYMINNGMSMDAKDSSAVGRYPHRLYWWHTDGSTTVEGLKGRVLVVNNGGSQQPVIAASPDGRKVYMVGLGANKGSPGSFVLSGRLDDDKPAQVFVGDQRAPGSDDRHFQSAEDIACDSAGRVYVVDPDNNRVQIYSEDGTHLKTLKLDRPRLVQVHAQTGVIYVAHNAWVQGRSTARLTRFKPFPDLSEVRHWDGLAPGTLTLDSYTAKPRLWTSGKRPGLGAQGELVADESAYSITVFEDNGERLVKVADFYEEAKKEAGANFVRWGGGNDGNPGFLTCDPTRERVYYNNGPIFDLRSRSLLGNLTCQGVWSTMQSYGGRATESMFDRRGYMHVRINGGLEWPRGSGVGRLKVGVAEVVKGHDGKERVMIPHVEVPYDYGGAGSNWRGAVLIHKTDHRFFNYGMGVNMGGDLAVSLLVENIGRLAIEESEILDSRGQVSGGYAEWIRLMQVQSKREEDFHPWPRYPGVPKGGGAIVTFDRNGELRSQNAVMAGQVIFGAQIGEDGSLYFINRNRNRVIDGQPFLGGKAGFFGTDKRFTIEAAKGVYMKTRGDKVRFACSSGVVPLDTADMPKRPPDLIGDGHGAGGNIWVDGAEWIYAGATPAKSIPIGCDCYHLRGYLDWYRRSFVPEAYRHSIGILDTNGNLIVHAGQYGNYDSGFGPKSRIPVGGDGIGITFIRFVAATDNYMVFDSWGERLCVVKLNYQVEDTVPIRAR